MDRPAGKNTCVVKRTPLSYERLKKRCGYVSGRNAWDSPLHRDPKSGIAFQPGETVQLICSDELGKRDTRQCYNAVTLSDHLATSGGVLDATWHSPTSPVYTESKKPVVNAEKLEHYANRIRQNASTGTGVFTGILTKETFTDMRHVYEQLNSEVYNGETMADILDELFENSSWLADTVVWDAGCLMPPDARGVLQGRSRLQRQQEREKTKEARWLQTLDLLRTAGQTTLGLGVLAAGLKLSL